MKNLILNIIDSVADRFFDWLMDVDYHFKDELWDDEDWF